MSAHKQAVRLAKLQAMSVFVICATSLCPQSQPPATAEVTGRVILAAAAKENHPPSVVVWLSPLEGSDIPVPSPGRFVLAQKNRTFTPHLLVIPVGSVVSFPNEDPFFHNVFSLFNGKRFDLGLYEAGSSREVHFSREGVSYIFCNIHPEMSAVVIALSTPLFDVADSAERFSIHSIPPGEYDLHVWIEGTQQPVLNKLTRRISVSSKQSASISIDASSTYHPVRRHLNMYGKPYPHDTRPPY